MSSLVLKMNSPLNMPSGIDNYSYYPIEVIATLMESDSNQEQVQSFASPVNDDFLSSASPLRTIFRVYERNTAISKSPISRLTSQNPYKFLPPNSVEIHGRGTYLMDGVSTAEEECSESFFDRFIKGFVDDAILGEDRTVVTLGLSGPDSLHPLFMKDEGLVHLALKRINEGHSDDIWKLLATITGATAGVSLVEVAGEYISDMLQDSKSDPSGSFKSWATPDVNVNDGLITGAQIVCSSNPDNTWSEITRALERGRDKKPASFQHLQSHKILQIYVRPTGGRLTFVDLCKSATDIEKSPSRLRVTSGWPFVKQTMEDLTSKKPKVPFEDAKLNRLMCEILTGEGSVGNAKTLLVLCASPKPAMVDQTVSTITTALRAREILRKCNEARIAKRLAAEQEKDRLLKQIQAKDVLISELQAKNSEMTALLFEQQKSGEFPLDFGGQAMLMPFNSRCSWPVRPETSRKQTVHPNGIGSEHCRIPDPIDNRRRVLPDVVDGLSEIGFGLTSKFQSRLSFDSPFGEETKRLKSNYLREMDLPPMDESNKIWAEAKFNMNFSMSGDDGRWPEEKDFDYDSDKLPEPFLKGSQNRCSDSNSLVKKESNLQKLEKGATDGKERTKVGSHSGNLSSGICCFGTFGKKRVACK